jgi:hypothetical protein
VTDYISSHPDWYANILKYGPDVVNIININWTNDLLWEDETRFYYVVQVLADAWNEGVNVCGIWATYIIDTVGWDNGQYSGSHRWMFQTVVAQYPYSAQYQFLYVDPPLKGTILFHVSAGPICLRPGFTLPATTTTSQAICSNHNIVTYNIPPPLVLPESLGSIQTKSHLLGNLTVHHIGHSFLYMGVILYPTPWVQWDQSLDMDMDLQKLFEISYTVGMKLQKPFEVSHTATMRLQTTFTIPQTMNILVRKNLEQTMSSSMRLRKDLELEYALSMVIAKTKEQNSDMVLLKVVEIPHYMFLHIFKESVEVNQTMDMTLIHVPDRFWTIPQHWNIQTIEELATNSTGAIFDSRNEQDRLAAGGT